MPVNPIWIPLSVEIIGTVAVPVILALHLEQHLEEKRMLVQDEIRRLDQEWEAARALGRKEGQRP